MGAGPGVAGVGAVEHNGNGNSNFFTSPNAILITLSGFQGKAPKGENDEVTVCGSCALRPEVLLEMQRGQTGSVAVAQALIRLFNCEGRLREEGGRDLWLACGLRLPLLLGLLQQTV